MGEIGLVKIKADAERFGPGNPALKLLNVKFVPVDSFFRRLGIAGVQIEPVPAWDKRKNLLEIVAQFQRCPSFAGVAARDGEPATKGLLGIFIAADIVALPAMNRDGDPGKFVQSRFRIHAQFGVALLCQAIVLLQLFGFHFLKLVGP